MRASLAIVLLSLFVGTAVQSGCSEREVLSKKEAEVIMAEARQLEQQQRLHRAYYKYKQVETTYLGADPMHDEAWDAAQRIRMSITAQRQQIEALLRQYFAAHGTYPSSLQEIRDQLPARISATLDGFIYERRSNTAFMLDDGIVGGT